VKNGCFDLDVCIKMQIQKVINLSLYHQERESLRENEILREHPPSQEPIILYTLKVIMLCFITGSLSTNNVVVVVSWHSGCKYFVRVLSILSHGEVYMCMCIQRPPPTSSTSNARNSISESLSLSL